MEGEVTQAMWNAHMGSNPSYFENCGATCPVETVSWFDAVVFANRLSRAEGLSEAYDIDGEQVTWRRDALGYRLLTEAEWERAARGGEPYIYAGGATADEVGWVGASGGGSSHPGCTARSPRNGYGLCDMTGNVWEWVWDPHGSYSSRSVLDPSGPESASSRVIRGGSWVNYPRSARVANRSWDAPGDRHHSVGLRLARPAR